MKIITLSYIITTRNKLPYLRETMAQLIHERREDEEILVADGASDDGTKEYLADLQSAGSIDAFWFEPDVGESHALNKLFLRAQGTLIKIITDDDAFFYPGIRACRSFLLEHPEIDLVSTNGGFKDQDPERTVRPLIYTKNYERWRIDQTPFSFCGLGIMLRRNSIPLLGLWDSSFRRADMEFSLRITAGKGVLAWYTAPCFVNISTPQSVSTVFREKILEETQKLERFYLDKKPGPAIMHKLRAFWIKARHPSAFRTAPDATPVARKTIVDISNQWLHEQNKSGTSLFLTQS